MDKFILYILSLYCVLFSTMNSTPVRAEHVTTWATKIGKALVKTIGDHPLLASILYVTRNRAPFTSIYIGKHLLSQWTQNYFQKDEELDKSNIRNLNPEICALIGILLETIILPAIFFKQYHTKPIL